MKHLFESQRGRTIFVSLIVIVVAIHQVVCIYADIAGIIHLRHDGECPWFVNNVASIIIALCGLLIFVIGGIIFWAIKAFIKGEFISDDDECY